MRILIDPLASMTDDTILHRLGSEPVSPKLESDLLTETYRMAGIKSELSRTTA